MTSDSIDFATLPGTVLGERVSSYDERDAILYALAVGAPATDLALVYERELRVLPTFALTLGLWVADAAGRLGAFVPEEALHGSQQLVTHRPLPARGRIPVSGRIAGVWDKGRSTVIDVVADSDYFTATYSIVVLGRGGWGGERGAALKSEFGDVTPVAKVPIAPNQAALYRLTGDWHLIHIDPDAAREAGFDRPILHGLCTLGIVARELASQVRAHPADLAQIEARFSAPLFPGETLDLLAGATAGGESVQFRADVADRSVISGHVRFAQTPQPIHS